MTQEADELSARISKKTKVTIAAALAAGMTTGAMADHLTNPPHEVSAKMVSMRVLQEGTDASGAKRPDRYAVLITTKVGAAQGARELVCEHDGSAPKLNGVPVNDASAETICKAAADFGKSAQTASEQMADRLSR